MTLLEDFALLLDTLVSLLLDFGVTLEEEDFVLLLDFALLLDTLVSLLLDFGVTLLEDFADSLDFGATLEEDFTLLLESSQSSQIADEDSSPHAASRVRRMEKVKKMDCFVTLAMT